jgi:hypothetical protein
MLSKNDLLAAPVKPLVRSRNIFWDTFFYDIDALSAAEITGLADSSDHEGAIVVVSPRRANRHIRHYDCATAMLKKERKRIGGVAIAGVGSSIVGTAALARNVADAYEIEVAGIISGYGATDLLAEALGGWFFYGYTDKIRHYVEIAVEKAAEVVPKTVLHAINEDIDISENLRQNWIPRQLDSGTLLDILRATPDNLQVVVGHSKGALLIDFVLTEFVRQLKGRRHRYFNDLHVVTVSAVVGVSRKFKKTSQIIGKLDWFGGINSLPDLLSDVNPKTRPKFVDNAWHHLNRDIPYWLSLVQSLDAYVPLH